MDHVRFACQLAGLVVPGHHSVPCPRSISTLLVLFSSWNRMCKLHCFMNCEHRMTKCWRLRCFMHMFLWDALTGTDLDRVSGMFGVCTPLTWSLDDLTPGGNSRLRYSWPSSLLTLCLPWWWTELFSLYTCVSLPLGSSKSVNLFWFFWHFFDVIRQDPADWNKSFAQRCLEGVNDVSF